MTEQDHATKRDLRTDLVVYERLLNEAHLGGDPEEIAMRDADLQDAWEAWDAAQEST